MSSPEHAEMRQAVIDGDADKATALAKELVSGSGDLLRAVEEGFVAGIRRVGELWEEGEYFLPELVQGAEAMKAAMAVVRPALSPSEGASSSKGRVVIGTVQGDLHDIGKSLVGTLLAANGYEVFDLGTDVPVDTFLGKAREVDAHIIGASALLTTTMSVQRQIVEAVEVAQMPRRPKVMVGGAPCSAAWAEKIGATFAENALAAVTVAERLLS